LSTMRNRKEAVRRSDGGVNSDNVFHRRNAKMATGTIKWFDSAKGYGFIVPDAGGDDLFLHVTNIEEKGGDPQAGDPVRYEIGEGRNGIEAKNVVYNILMA